MKLTRRTMLLSCPAIAVAVPGVSFRAFPGHLRVLLVDDNALFRTVLKPHLVAWGFHVTEAEDPDAGLACLRREPDCYHAVLSDLILPGMTGIDMLKLAGPAALGRARPLIFGGYAHREVAAMLDDVGAAYLAKPLSLDQLRARLTDLCGAEWVSQSA